MTLIISQTSWETSHRHGYTHILADGRPAVLRYDEQAGTVLAPVVVIPNPGPQPS